MGEYVCVYVKLLSQSLVGHILKKYRTGLERGEQCFSEYSVGVATNVQRKLDFILERSRQNRYYKVLKNVEFIWKLFRKPYRHNFDFEDEI